MSDYSIEVKRVLGCRFDRPGKGDHELWLSPISNRRFVVDSKIKSRHTANAVYTTGSEHAGDLPVL